MYFLSCLLTFYLVRSQPHYTACNGLADGDACSFTKRDGTVVNGNCDGGAVQFSFPRVPRERAHTKHKFHSDSVKQMKLVRKKQIVPRILPEVGIKVKALA